MTLPSFFFTAVRAIGGHAKDAALEGGLLPPSKADSKLDSFVNLMTRAEQDALPMPAKEPLAALNDLLPSEAVDNLAPAAPEANAATARDVAISLIQPEIVGNQIAPAAPRAEQIVKMEPVTPEPTGKTVVPRTVSDATEEIVRKPARSDVEAPPIRSQSNGNGKLHPNIQTRSAEVRAESRPAAPKKTAQDNPAPALRKPPTTTLVSISIPPKQASLPKVKVSARSNDSPAIPQLQHPIPVEIPQQELAAVSAQPAKAVQETVGTDSLPQAQARAAAPRPAETVQIFSVRPQSTGQVVPRSVPRMAPDVTTPRNVQPAASTPSRPAPDYVSAEHPIEPEIVEPVSIPVEIPQRELAAVSAQPTKALQKSAGTNPNSQAHARETAPRPAETVKNSPVQPAASTPSQPGPDYVSVTHPIDFEIAEAVLNDQPKKSEVPIVSIPAQQPQSIVRKVSTEQPVVGPLESDPQPGAVKPVSETEMTDERRDIEASAQATPSLRSALPRASAQPVQIESLSPTLSSNPPKSEPGQPPQKVAPAAEEGAGRQKEITLPQVAILPQTRVTVPQFGSPLPAPLPRQSVPVSQPPTQPEALVSTARAAQPETPKVVPSGPVDVAVSNTQSPPPPAVPHEDVKPALAHVAARTVPVSAVQSKPQSNESAPPPPALPSVVLPVESALQAASLASIQPDGTQGALKGPNMSFAGKKNEIAGRTEQKVPVASQSGDSSPKEAKIATVAADSGRPGSRQQSFDTSVPVNFSTKTADLNTAAAKPAPTASPVIDHSALMAERLGNMVSQQVVMVRQSGANNLAVSLKLDPQTEVSLQLTSHNGQIEAAVNWERGSIAGMENHWRDLQDALARQNVQLLPLENKPAQRTPAFTSTASAGGSDSSSSFEQFSRDSQRNSGQARPELPEPGAVRAPVVKQNKTETAAPARTVARQSWESWA